MGAGGGEIARREKFSGWYSLPLSLRWDQQLRRGFQVQRECLCYSCFMAQTRGHNSNEFMKYPFPLGFCVCRKRANSTL